jgi:hypothetical protein
MDDIINEQATVVVIRTPKTISPRNKRNDVGDLTEAGKKELLDAFDAHNAVCRAPYN